MKGDSVDKAEKYGHLLGKAICKMLKDDSVELWAFLYGVFEEIFEKRLKKTK
jgi:hypothetical protein